jgi:hypothetical protein
MPRLNRRSDGGYFVTNSFTKGGLIKHTTYQVEPRALEILASRGIRSGDDFPIELFHELRKDGLFVTNRSGPGEEVADHTVRRTTELDEDRHLRRQIPLDVTAELLNTDGSFISFGAFKVRYGGESGYDDDILRAAYQNLKNRAPTAVGAFSGAGSPIDEHTSGKAKTCVQDEVINLARTIHNRHWLPNRDESHSTKAAIQICREWQQAVINAFPGQFVGECVIGSDCGERIDLVDQHEKIAYELKASPNNTHMEFYRDIFKTWVQRESGDEPLKRLVFITPETGARRLQAGFGQQVIRLAQQHGLAIEIAAI